MGLAYGQHYKQFRHKLRIFAQRGDVAIRRFPIRRSVIRCSIWHQNSRKDSKPSLKPRSFRNWWTHFSLMLWKNILMALMWSRSTVSSCLIRWLNGDPAMKRNSGKSLTRWCVKAIQEKGESKLRHELTIYKITGCFIVVNIRIYNNEPENYRFQRAKETLINWKRRQKKPSGIIIIGIKDDKKWDNYHSQKQNIQNGRNEQREKNFLIWWMGLFHIMCFFAGRTNEMSL